MMLDHTEAVLAKKAQIDIESLKHNMDNLANEESRHSRASLHHAELIEEKKLVAHQNVVDHTEAVLAKKAQIEEETSNHKIEMLGSEEGRHSRASLHHAESVEGKKLAAHHSEDDLSAARQRKQLHDAIDDAAIHRKAHDIELKQELAFASRADKLHGIQEKQKHLQ
jgi:hypothetical protein